MCINVIIVEGFRWIFQISEGVIDYMAEKKFKK
jgi:hypothetical protein